MTMTVTSSVELGHRIMCASGTIVLFESSYRMTRSVSKDSKLSAFAALVKLLSSFAFVVT